MAQKVVVSLVDDLDGSQADRTVQFGFDGRNYEIDLSSDNEDKLRAALADYVASARRPGSGTRGGRTSTTAVDREQNQAIREWARQRGMKVSDRGRISSEITEAYREAQK